MKTNIQAVSNTGSHRTEYYSSHRSRIKQTIQLGRPLFFIFKFVLNHHRHSFHYFHALSKRSRPIVRRLDFHWSAVAYLVVIMFPEVNKHGNKGKKKNHAESSVFNYLSMIYLKTLSKALPMMKNPSIVLET